MILKTLSKLRGVYVYDAFFFLMYMTYTPANHNYKVHDDTFFFRFRWRDVRETKNVRRK